MVEPEDAIFEEREELMLSPTGGNPTVRIAHFLKPSVVSIDELPSPFFSAEPTISELENLPMKVQFKGWQNPHVKWKMWVGNLHSKYQSMWKKAGIIIASQHSWLEHFMGNGSKYEHEAFLSYWLSKFVFPMPHYRIEKRNFPLAIHLARGTQIALAPAVLSSVYTDLGLLKEKLFASKKLDYKEVLISAPFQLVQLWAWERFTTFRPTPISITQGEPRPARWHKVKVLGIENVRLAIDSAGENFLWRPYAIALNHNWLFPKFYGDKEQWVSVDAALDKGLESYTRCLRACELVGVQSMQQYLPHRVAMQFGIDQDLPGHVARYISLSQSMSHSTANDGAPKKDSMIIPEAKVTQDEGSKGEAGKSVADTTVREVGRSTNVAVHVKHNDGENSNHCITEMPALELEARISRLERVAAELKAARAK
ncbi:hypothetical protein CFP56_007749 [Quercus suber]|uniref:Aminotransferase-like plant mobile domain-containing protein n=1 Tax=Quercus suber TaxID=58331 RepID=A0AAW0M8Z5_QUESU